MHNELIFRGLSYSYHKLPKKRIKLSILKLDGSSFGIEVPANATVAELKFALQEFFSLLPKNERCVVSWSHVWGHFCLCYEGQKLLDDKACIQKIGIKDGDQIKFVRHVTINYRPTRKQMKNESDEFRRCSVYESLPSISQILVACFHSKSSAHEDEELADSSSCNSVEGRETNIYQCQCEEDESVFLPGSKLTNFLKGWFSYRKFRNDIVSV